MSRQATGRALGAMALLAGTAFAASLYAGPGGSRVRSPLAWIVHPLSRTAGGWRRAVKSAM